MVRLLWICCAALLFVVPSAWACSCVPTGDPREEIEQFDAGDGMRLFTSAVEALCAASVEGR